MWGIQNQFKPKKMHFHSIFLNDYRIYYFKRGKLPNAKNIRAIVNMHVLSQAQKQPSLYDFLTKMRTNASLIPNPNHETEKKNKKTTYAKPKFNKILLQGGNKNRTRL